MINKALLMLIAISVFSIVTQAQAPNGVVYIESNIGHVSGQNSIIAFKRDAAGRLTKFGEYLTGGTGVHPIGIDLNNLPGTIGPFDSDQDVILNKNGTRLFAVNSGSDSIAVFDVKADGSLVPVAGSPFPSGGVNPISVGLAADESILVVVNQDYDIARAGFDAANRSPNHTSFRIDPLGKLIPIPHSTIIAGRGGSIGPGNSTPSQALIAPGGRIVIDADSFGSAVTTFTVDTNGRLEFAASSDTPASEFVPFPGLPIPAGRPLVLGLAAHPTEPIFYAGFGFDAPGKVAVYTYNQTGQVEFQRTVNAGLGTCWVVANAAGTRVYAVNTLVNTVSVLDTSDPLHPVNIQNFQLAGPTVGAQQASIDSRGEYLYVVSQAAVEGMPPESNALHVLRIAADGSIAAQTDRVVIPVSPSLPQGVAAR
jgi:DNA-binding beta-propeller fold protein YncE